MQPEANDLIPARPILIIDDEESLVRSIDNILRNAGMNHVLRCSDSREAEALVLARHPSTVLLDLSMPHVSGQDILSRITATFPEMPVIIVTATMEIETAINCMKDGAFDYLVKPIDKHRLVATVTKALQLHDLRQENIELRKTLLSTHLEHPDAFAAIKTQSDSMLAIFKYAEAIARSEQSVLVTGETGVGKELIARAIHALSERHGAFVGVNTAGLDETMFSDTFFGHIRGAYTGADAARHGLIEKAAHGTLLMDEIGDLAPGAQIKLLRLLQDGEYFPLGSDVPQRCTARIIAATNRDLRALVNAGKFREDLYFRLLSHHIRIPPLRERLGDLPLLVNHFLEQSALAIAKKRPTAPKELITYLSGYPFPGNVRELRAMVYDAVSSHDGGVMSISSFINHMDQHGSATLPTSGMADEKDIRFPPLLPTVKEATIQLIEEALHRAENNQGAAARALGLSRQSLNKYFKEIRERQSARL